MKVSVKLSVAFSLAAVFLLIVEIVAVIVVGRLDGILADTNRYSLQSSQIAETIQAYRLAPQQTTFHLARLDDLGRLARTPDEQRLIATVRQELPTNHFIPALEELATFYRRATVTATQRLSTIHHWVTVGLVVIIFESIVLFALLTWLVRRWLLRPLGFLNQGVTAMARGDLQRQVSPIGDEEFVQLADGLNRIGLELRALRESAETNQRLATVGEACSHVTHNVRSLLNSIRSLAQYESTARTAAPDARVGFNYIIALVNKLDQWVRDLHSTVAPVNPSVGAFQIEPIVQDAISLIEPQVSEKNLQVEYHADESLPRAQIDRGLFEQAFLAVFNNAVQAAPIDSRIGVRLTQSTPERVAVTVEDTGPGMSDEIRQRAFDPYFTTKPESAGLGLTIARAILKRHGGEIQIETGPAKGTRVTLHFPVAKPS